MKKIVYFSLLFVFCSALSKDQNLNSSRMEGMAGAGMSILDVSNVSRNPASIGSNRILKSGDFDLRVQTTYKPNLLHEDIHENAVWIGSSLKSWIHCGFSVQQMRFSKIYYENSFAIALARNIGPRFYLGFSVVYNLNKLLNYNHVQNWNGHVGVLYIINEKLSLSFLGQNLLEDSFKVSQYDEGSPSFGIGSAYILSSSLRWVLDGYWHGLIQKSTYSNSRIEIRTGLEYSILPQTLWIRIGWKNSPVSQYFGIGYRKSNFSFDLSFGNYGRLGIVPQIDLGYVH